MVTPFFIFDLAVESHVLINKISLFDYSRQTKIHNIGATLIGVDKLGNKYYQKLGDTQYGTCVLITWSVSYIKACFC